MYPSMEQFQLAVLSLKLCLIFILRDSTSRFHQLNLRYGQEVLTALAKVVLRYIQLSKGLHNSKIPLVVWWSFRKFSQIWTNQQFCIFTYPLGLIAEIILSLECRIFLESIERSNFAWVGLAASVSAVTYIVVNLKLLLFFINVSIILQYNFKCTEYSPKIIVL